VPITVAICTLNRAESLRRTLDSLAAMRVPEGLVWELVVVNNDCNDLTDDVIKSFADRLPVRREFEAQRGTSRARNRAVDAAIGDYIVWTDDDVVVDRGWLVAYVDAFLFWPGAAVFGGPVIPRFDAPTPMWLAGSHEQISGAFAGRDLGDSVQSLGVLGDRVPYGANFALRSIEQRNFRYDPDLGHGSSRRRLGEEADVIARILQSGGSGYWIPQAKVEHCIGQDRQTVPYLFRFFVAVGETRAYLSEAETPPVGDAATAPSLFGVARWRWRNLLEHWLRYRLHRLASPAPVWMSHLKTYAIARGEVGYWRSRSIDARRSGHRGAEPRVKSD
jgi:glycosyltransferase involved in cell wall biosynthesis